MERQELGVVEFRRSISETLNQVAYRDAEVVITRNGRPVAVLLSLAAYEGRSEIPPVRTPGGRLRLAELDALEKVDLSQPASNFLLRAHEDLYRTLIAQLRRLPANPYPRGSRRLATGSERLRVGEHRIVYSEERGNVRVEAIGTRGDVYRELGIEA